MDKNKNISIKTLKTSLSIFFKVGKHNAFITSVTYLIISLIPSVLLIVNKQIFEVFSFHNFSVLIILKLLIFYTILSIISRILLYVQNLITSKIQHDIEVYLYKMINIKIVSMSYADMDNPNIKDLITRLTNNAPNKSAKLIFSMFSTISIIIQIITACTILVGINWIIPVLLVVFSIPYIVMYKRMCFDNYFKEVNQGKFYRKDWYLIKMLFSKQYNKELKFYRLFDYIGSKEYMINKSLHTENYELTKKYTIYGAYLDILKGVGKGISMIWTIWLILFRNVNISAITILIQSMDSIQKGLLGVFSNLRDLNSTMFIFSDYETFSKLAEEEGNHEIYGNEAEFIYDIENVSFKYQENEYDTLKDVNLQIRKGEKVAIVGCNGSGKTTLVNLLLGLYKPTKGTIKVFGTPVEDCFKDLRRKTVYIMQNLPHYGFNIVENLYMGGEQKNSDIIRILNIDNIIEKAPYKAETMLGEENEHRYDLSGGEWTKIGIARNCQKDEPNLFILDEPTAALDPLMESKVYESFNEITGNSTAIFISHRLGMMQLVDRILVMNEGKIEEVGSHDELMLKGGIYYSMYNEQRSLYMKES